MVPNVAVIEELKSKADILYIGSKNGPERAIIEKLSIKFSAISCGKLRRYFSWDNAKDAFRIPVGMFQAYKILKEFRPDVIFSKGGYVSFPVIVAAFFLKIPTIIHESDVHPGLANRMSFPFAKKILVSFEESFKYLKKQSRKVELIAPPIRKFLFTGSKEAGLKFTGLNNYRPVILVMGGSLGAGQINDLVRDSLDELLKQFQVVHITGRGHLDIGVHKTGYVQYEFLDQQLADVYAMSELVISRAGANSLFEIAALGKKAIIIPLGNAGSRGEQIENARVMCPKMGWLLMSGQIDKKDFINTVKLAYMNDVNAPKNEQSGAEEIVKILLKTKR